MKVSETPMSPRLTKDDENTLPFKGRDRVGMGSSSEEKTLRVCYLGTYTMEEGYPRNRVIIEGLRKNGVNVIECHEDFWRNTEEKLEGVKAVSISAMLKSIGRLLRAYRSLFYKFRKVGSYDVMIVGYAGHLDIFFASVLNIFRRRPILFDAFLSLYDTAVMDRRIVSPGSLKAKLLWLMDRWSCRMADAVLLDTPAHVDYFVREFRLPAEKFYAIPVGSFIKVHEEPHPHLNPLPEGEEITLRFTKEHDNPLSPQIPPPLSSPSCLPPKWVEEFGRDAIAALPQGEGGFERLPIIPPPLMGGGEGGGERRGFSGEHQKEWKDRFTVLYFGSYIPLHGVDVILNAAKIIQDKGNGLPSVIPAQAGIQNADRRLDSHLRGNDEHLEAFSDEPSCPFGVQRSIEIPPPLNPLPQGEGRYERLPKIPPPLMGGGEGEGEQGVLAPLPLVPSHEGRGNKGGAGIGWNGVVFTLVGTGQLLPEMKALASSLGLKNVIFIDRFVSEEELVGYIRQADLCLGVFGQTDKAARVIPCKVYNCLAMGKPLITMSSPATEGVLMHKENAYLCNPGDPEALAEAVITLKNDKALRENTGKSGKEFFERNFSTEVIGRRILDIVEGVICCR